MISKTNILNEILPLNSASPSSSIGIGDFGLSPWPRNILGSHVCLYYGVEGGNTEEINSHLLSVHYIRSTVHCPFTSIILFHLHQKHMKPALLFSSNDEKTEVRGMKLLTAQPENGRAWSGYGFSHSRAQTHFITAFFLTGFFFLLFREYSC